MTLEDTEIHISPSVLTCQRFLMRREFSTILVFFSLSRLVNVGQVVFISTLHRCIELVSLYISVSYLSLRKYFLVTWVLQHT